LVLLPRPVLPPAVIPFLSTPRGGLTHSADKGQPKWQSNGSTQDFSIYHHPFDRSSRLKDCLADVNSVAFERNSDSVGQVARCDLAQTPIEFERAGRPDGDHFEQVSCAECGIGLSCYA